MTTPIAYWIRLLMRAVEHESGEAPSDTLTLEEAKRLEREVILSKLRRNEIDLVRALQAIASIDESYAGRQALH